MKYVFLALVLLATSGCGAQQPWETVRSTLAIAEEGLRILDVPDEVRPVVDSTIEIIANSDVPLEAWRLASSDSPPQEWIDWAQELVDVAFQLISTFTGHEVRVPCWMNMVVSVITSFLSMVCSL